MFYILKSVTVATFKYFNLLDIKNQEKIRAWQIILDRINFSGLTLKFKIFCRILLLFLNSCSSQI